MQNLPEIDNLIKLISKLPGLGPKSAKRIILKMINNRQEILKPLSNNLSDVFKNIERCKICGTLKSKTSEEISKATGGLGVPGFKWPL